MRRGLATRFRGPSSSKQPYAYLEYTGVQASATAIQNKGLTNRADLVRSVREALTASPKAAFKATQFMDRNTVWPKNKHFGDRDALMVDINMQHENPAMMKRAYGYQSAAHFAHKDVFRSMLERFYDNNGDTGSAEAQIGLCVVRMEEILTDLGRAFESYQAVKDYRFDDTQMNAAWNFAKKCIKAEHLVEKHEKLSLTEYQKRVVEREKIRLQNGIMEKDQAIDHLKLLVFVPEWMESLKFFSWKMGKLLEYLNSVSSVRYNKVIRLIGDIYDSRDFDYESVRDTFQELPPEELDFYFPILLNDPENLGKKKLCGSIPAEVALRNIKDE
jgi:hypothetical protein